MALFFFLHSFFNLSLELNNCHPKQYVAFFSNCNRLCLYFSYGKCRGAETRRVAAPAPTTTGADGSIKFTFEEDEDEDGKQWMFCHVPGCSFWTSKSFRMQRHKLCHSEPSELEVKRCYKCPDCHLKFYSLAKLLKHDRRKHTGIKDYECRICGAEVTDIQTHMRVRMITK